MSLHSHETLITLMTSDNELTTGEFLPNKPVCYAQVWERQRLSWARAFSQFSRAILPHWANPTGRACWALLAVQVDKMNHRNFFPPPAPHSILLRNADKAWNDSCIICVLSAYDITANALLVGGTNGHFFRLFSHVFTPHPVAFPSSGAARCGGDPPYVPAETSDPPEPQTHSRSWLRLPPPPFSLVASPIFFSAHIESGHLHRYWLSHYWLAVFLMGFPQLLHNWDACTQPGLEGRCWTVDMWCSLHLVAV